MTHCKKCNQQLSIQETLTNHRYCHQCIDNICIMEAYEHNLEPYHAHYRSYINLT